MVHRMLGLSCGAPGGSAEILLVTALRAARSAGATTELVRLDELRIPSGPDPSEPDDIWWFWERLVECDGLVVSSPIISRTLTARLKLLIDRLLGPNADAAIIEGLLQLQRSGQPPQVPFRVDERVLKPRVAGFIACGGSLTPQWKSLALPTMHATTFSMHIKVVDQMVVEGAGTPRSVVLDESAVERAGVLGTRVASQLGRAFDEAEYLGDEGLCPMCQLSVLVVSGRDVECATCGARGRFDQTPTLKWTDLSTSVISMDEKRTHYAEILETARRHAVLRDVIEERAAGYAEPGLVIRPDRNPDQNMDNA